MSKRSGIYCSANGCLNKHKAKDGKSYFNFPTDPERWRLWLHAIDRNDLIERFEKGKVYHRVCSDHFSSNDFEIRKLLKNDVVPKLHLELGPTDTKNASAQTVSWLNICSPFTTVCKYTQTPSSMANILETSRKRKLEEEMEVLKKQLKKIDDKKNITKEDFFNLCDQYLDQKLANFIKCQGMLKNKSKANRYDSKFKVFCFNLYFLNPLSYKCLDQFFNLPSVRTLQRMQIPISTAINDHFIVALKSRVSDMNKKEKVCCVCIGSMPLKANLYYDIATDKVHGLHEVNNITSMSPANNAIVILVQGVFVKWTQPIGYALTADRRNYPELSEWIYYVLTLLLDIGFDVRALIMDLDSDYLNVSNERDNNSFEINGKKIYFIFDPPNLIKRTRNYFLKYNFCCDEKVAKWEYVKAAYDIDSSNELKLMPKLTENHTKLNNVSKNDVKFSAQLFSHSVAAYLKFLITSSFISSEASHTVDLILLLNNLFDILNSSSKDADYIYKREYTGSKEQEQFLSNCLAYLEKLKLVKENGREAENYITFINGFIITIQSVIGLFKDLKSEGFTYLLTRNLNQDLIEEFFDRIKLHCSDNTEPIPIQFNRSFRKLFVVNVLKETKSNDCEDLKSTLMKITEFLTANEQSDSYDVSVNEINEMTLKTGVMDYKFDLPETNALVFMSGYLMRKCIEKHDCERFLSYHQELYPNISKENLQLQYQEYNPNNVNKVGLITPPDDFISLVIQLETHFIEYFKENGLGNHIGYQLFNYMKDVSFDEACPCFPLIFLKKLFIRLRIHFMFKENNKEFKMNRKSRNVIKISYL